MCGIAGFVVPSYAVDTSLTLRAMADAIAHRGPDDDGYYEQPMVYSAMYNKTVEGITARKRSIIVEMDPNNNYKIRRCFQLSSALEYGHVGGIAFFGNRGSCFFRVKRSSCAAARILPSDTMQAALSW